MEFVDLHIIRKYIATKCDVKPLIEENGGCLHWDAGEMTCQISGPDLVVVGAPQPLSFGGPLFAAGATSSPLGEPRSGART